MDPSCLLLRRLVRYCWSGRAVLEQKLAPKACARPYSQHNVARQATTRANQAKAGGGHMCSTELAQARRAERGTGTKALSTCSTPNICQAIWCPRLTGLWASKRASARSTIQLRGVHLAIVAFSGSIGHAAFPGILVAQCRSHRDFDHEAFMSAHPAAVVIAIDNCSLRLECTVRTEFKLNLQLAPSPPARRPTWRCSSCCKHAMPLLDWQVSCWQHASCSLPGASLCHHYTK